VPVAGAFACEMWGNVARSINAKKTRIGLHGSAARSGGWVDFMVL